MGIYRSAHARSHEDGDASRHRREPSAAEHDGRGEDTTPPPAPQQADHILIRPYVLAARR